MHKWIPNLAAVTLSFFAGHAYAACSYPTEPGNLPDGSNATLEEMKTAQKAVKEFDLAITAYTSCLKLEHDAAMAKSPDMPAEKKKDLERVLSEKHNAAIEADEALAARFNEQVKAFKAKSAS